jgi:hypothetical protein
MLIVESIKEIIFNMPTEGRKKSSEVNPRISDSIYMLTLFIYELKERVFLAK